MMNKFTILLRYFKSIFPFIYLSIRKVRSRGVTNQFSTVIRLLNYTSFPEFFWHLKKKVAFFLFPVIFTFVIPMDTKKSSAFSNII